MKAAIAMSLIAGASATARNEETGEGSNRLGAPAKRKVWNLKKALLPITAVAGAGFASHQIAANNHRARLQQQVVYREASDYADSLAHGRPWHLSQQTPQLSKKYLSEEFIGVARRLQEKLKTFNDEQTSWFTKISVPQLVADTAYGQVTLAQDSTHQKDDAELLLSVPREKVDEYTNKLVKSFSEVEDRISTKDEDGITYMSWWHTHEIEDLGELMVLGGRLAEAQGPAPSDGPQKYFREDGRPAASEKSDDETEEPLPELDN